MSSFTLGLKAGEWVEVKSREEILATLDDKCCLDCLPFMPEMFQYCGSRQRVYKRAHKTCDTINYSGGRRVHGGAVHLEGLRCDGGGHGGCQAECLIFWKEAWLRRAADAGADFSQPERSASKENPSRRTERDVIACSCRSGEAGKETRYACQATELLKATSPLSWWDLRQYLEDFGSGNVGVKGMLKGFAYVAYTAGLMRLPWIGKWFKRLFNGTRRLLGRPRHPRTWGRIPAGSPTPSLRLDLQPEEHVRVKDFETILETIDTNYRNRGMVWDAEMAPYCGGVFKVKKRIERIIDEKTGKMLNFKSDAVILDGVVCQAKYSDCRHFCPRAIYPYWREIWLERLPKTDANGAAVGPDCGNEI